MFNTKGSKELFTASDLLLVVDANYDVLFYEGYDDSLIVMDKNGDPYSNLFDMYPTIPPDTYTVVKAMKEKRPIVNELQVFKAQGKTVKCINTAYPLISDGVVIGAISLSTDLTKAMYATKHNFQDILTEDPEFLKRLETLKILSRNNSSILIYGETGTGKELIAHTIHANSTRYGKPFIIQNCAAIPTSLMEGLFFGTAKGSFTGAIDKPGLFEAANGGTLFLDEVNSLPIELQGKILRAIENRSITRVGESKERSIDVRILSSTNEDLATKVTKREFRADLYYRINVVRFDIPPLRNRICDINILTNHYVHYYNAIFFRDVKGIDFDAMNTLCSYSWPGNVRELKNMIEAIMNVKHDGFITVSDLPNYLLESKPSSELLIGNDLDKSQLPFGTPQITPNWDPNQTLAAQLEVFEQSIIKDAYLMNNRVISKTASVLKISRQTLYNKLSKYGLI